jgi:DNA-binding MarR family transcriptional regulator/ribosomal protein S18 acetylase RimI-like enzyme
MADEVDQETGLTIAAIRSFNRFYTTQMGALDEHLLDSSFTLTETRVLFEIGDRDGLSAAQLARDLRQDKAYLSRILRRFVQAGLVTREPNPMDRRAGILALTAKGRAEFHDLVHASNARISGTVGSIPASRRAELVTAMRAIRAILGSNQRSGETDTVIREARMGDFSWVVHRQATLYRDEYGWTTEFEALVLEIASNFLTLHEGQGGKCWVAEQNGAILGSVFLVRGQDGEAVLRLLYVEPDARGLGLGRRLAQQCISSARKAGYRTMRLWTNDVLTEARRLYDALGFVQVEEKKHADFGPPMAGQILELYL